MLCRRCVSLYFVRREAAEPVSAGPCEGVRDGRMRKPDSGLLLSVAGAVRRPSPPRCAECDCSATFLTLPVPNVRRGPPQRFPIRALNGSRLAVPSRRDGTFKVAGEQFGSTRKVRGSVCMGRNPRRQVVGRPDSRIRLPPTTDHRSHFDSRSIRFSHFVYYGDVKNAYQNLISARNGLRISGLEFGFDRDSKRIGNSRSSREELNRFDREAYQENIT
jgi:hypothetical protein